MKIWLGSVCLGFFVASSAMAVELYVDNVAGDDRHNGRAPQTLSTGGGPCRSIGRALKLAQRGDRINVANTGVPYRECITLQGGRHSGYAHRPFVIRGNGAILDGSTPVDREAWEHVKDHVFRIRPPRQSYQQLFLDGIPLERVRLSDELLTLPELEPLQWCLVNGHVYLRTEKDRLPQFYDLSFTGHPVGVTLYQVAHVVIGDLIVQGFQLDGLNAHDSAMEVTLLQMTARGNGRSGFSIGGASKVTLEGCLAGDNGAAQIRTEGYSHTHLKGSEVLANTAPAIVREAGEVTIDGQAFDGDELKEDLLLPEGAVE